MRICKYGFSNWPSSSWILLPSGQNPLFHGIVEQHAKQKPSANLKIVSSTFSTILGKHQFFMNLLQEHLGSKKDIHSATRDGSTVMSCHPILQIQCTKTRQGTSKRFSLRDFQLEVQGSSFKWFFARSKISLGSSKQLADHVFWWRNSVDFVHIYTSTLTCIVCQCQPCFLSTALPRCFGLAIL